jgi:transcriptional regulator with XRE-family HTH domain
MSTVLSLRTELQRRRGDWPALCQATGLSYSWLTKFAQGRIREPGLSKIERLREYVEARPVEPAETRAA